MCTNVNVHMSIDNVNLPNVQLINILAGYNNKSERISFCLNTKENLNDAYYYVDNVSIMVEDYNKLNDNDKMLLRRHQNPYPCNNYRKVIKI